MNILKSCKICPRKCNINRLEGQRGFCNKGALISVAKAMVHFWEEPPVSGINGSGTVFFSGCNLKCIYCQNYNISHKNSGKEINEINLANIFLSLQDKKVHNINLVTPTIHLSGIIKGIKIARKKGLNIPIIYNTGGYEDIETLRLLEGLVDIYLPDLKYFSPCYSKEYSEAENYFSVASKAIKEMFRQVGPPIFSDNGIIQKGLIIRHLILPGHREDTKMLLQWIRENLSLEVPLSLMSQYFPSYKAIYSPLLSQTLREDEYEEVIDYFFQIGLENGYIQDLTSSEELYVPEFDFDGI